MECKIKLCQSQNEAHPVQQCHVDVDGVQNNWMAILYYKKLWNVKLSMAKIYPASTFKVENSKTYKTRPHFQKNRSINLLAYVMSNLKAPTEWRDGTLKVRAIERKIKLKFYPNRIALVSESFNGDGWPNQQQSITILFTTFDNWIDWYRFQKQDSLRWKEASKKKKNINKLTFIYNLLWCAIVLFFV